MSRDESLGYILQDEHSGMFVEGMYSSTLACMFNRDWTKAKLMNVTKATRLQDGVAGRLLKRELVLKQGSFSGTVKG